MCLATSLYYMESGNMNNLLFSAMSKATVAMTVLHGMHDVHCICNAIQHAHAIIAIHYS